MAACYDNAVTSLYALYVHRRWNVVSGAYMWKPCICICLPCCKLISVQLFSRETLSCVVQWDDAKPTDACTVLPRSFESVFQRCCMFREVLGHYSAISSFYEVSDNVESGRLYFYHKCLCMRSSATVYVQYVNGARRRIIYLSLRRTGCIRQNSRNWTGWLIKVSRTKESSKNRTKACKWYRFFSSN